MAQGRPGRGLGAPDRDQHRDLVPAVLAHAGGRSGDQAPGPAHAACRPLFNALRKLPPKQAAAIVLRHHHGYTNREIAAALEIPERTVASRLIAAKARLKTLLDSEPGSGPQIDMSTLSEDSVPSD